MVYHGNTFRYLEKFRKINSSMNKTFLYLESKHNICFFFFQDRDNDLQLEKKRQEENDKLRQHFAEYANAFHTWLRTIEYASHFFLSV